MKVQKLRQEMFKIQDSWRIQRNGDDLAALEKRVTGEYLEALK